MLKRLGSDTFVGALASTFAVLGGALIGCSTVDSSDVPTGEMYVRMSVASRTGRIRAEASITQGEDGSAVELVGEDRFLFRHESIEEPMEKRSLFGDVWYESTTAGLSLAAPYEIVLRRGAAEFTSSTTLPAPVDLRLQIASQEFSRADDEVIVTWPPGDDSTAILSWQAEGDCITRREAPVTGDTVIDSSDPGLLRIPARTFTTPAGREEESCQVTVRVLREIEGTISDSFDDGYIFGQQVGEVGIVSSP